MVAYENSLGGLWGRKFKLDARDDQFDTGQNRSQTVDLIGKAFGYARFVLALRRRRRRADQSGEHSRHEPRARRRHVSKIPNNFSIQPSVTGGPLGPFNYFKEK